MQVLIANVVIPCLNEYYCKEHPMEFNNAKSALDIVIGIKKEEHEYIFAHNGGFLWRIIGTEKKHVPNDVISKIKLFFSKDTILTV